MKQKKITFIVVALGVLLVTVSVFLMTATPAKAQCGSQASSCKNCHETQAQGPVNNDGTDWHSQHSFGDFCYLCHAGNNQATDKALAHTGMVAPLSDINAGCQGCHPNDTLALAQIYATTLGQQVGIGAGATPQPGTSTDATSGAAPTAQAVVVPAADMVDYSQRYDEIALGKKPVNIGNIIAFAILAVIVLGGGFFVLRREGLINISFEDPKRISVSKKYPADVIGMLPALGKLNPNSRRILQNILAKPRVAADLLASIDKLTHEEPVDEQSAEEQPAEEQKE